MRTELFREVKAALERWLKEQTLTRGQAMELTALVISRTHPAPAGRPEDMTPWDRMPDDDNPIPGTGRIRKKRGLSREVQARELTEQL